MDENTWRLAQLIMWLFGTQTAILGSLLLIIWNRISKVEEKINNIDKRLVAVETLLHMKECCILKDNEKLKKAE